MEKKKYLYCYKMTHDTGFAPNPYHGVLTLATCKPTIRRCAEEGYWISGWAANVVQGKKQKYTDKAQRLIFLAKVEKVISYKDYWEETEKVYSKKKQPTKSKEKGKECFKSCGNRIVTNNEDIAFCGDNIYEPIKGKNNEFEQHENPHHDNANKAHDLSGKNVLICNDFYYFGIENALEIKNKDFVVPRCRKFSLEDNEAKAVIEYVTKNYGTGINPKKK